MNDKSGSVDAVLSITRRILEGLALAESIDGMPTLIDLTLAIEIVASMNRRQIRDRGIDKDSYLKVQAAASKFAGSIYEDSGLGKNIRRDAANGKTDSGFTAKQWQDAEAAAREAIAKAMKGDA